MTAKMERMVDEHFFLEVPSKRSALAWRRPILQYYIIITPLVNWSSKLRDNDERKNTLVGRICVLLDENKILIARSLLLFKWEITSFSKTMLLQRECFILSTALQCSLPSQRLSYYLFLSNYQTCTFPLKKK